MTADNEKKSTEEQQSWLFKIVVLPKYLGEFIFAIIGKENVSETTKFILGYMIFFGAALLILGIIAPETLKALIDFLY